MQAALVLGDIGAKRSIKLLIKALMEVVSDVRLFVAKAFGKIGDARAVESITEALKDKNNNVRKVAKKALKRIKAKGS
mgnify:CR=1 FL=1